MDNFRKFYPSFLERYSLYAILTLGFFLRIFNLIERDFWYDEAFTGIAVKEDFHEMLRIITNDIHPPLYYFLLKLFAWPLDYSIFGIRFFSVIWGILGIYAAYLLAEELFDRQVALFAALLAAISPFVIQYSQEGRMYAMFSALIVLAVYFLVKAQKSSFIKEYILFGVFWGLACLTHYLGIIFAPIFYSLFVLENLKHSRKISWRSFLPNKSFILGSLAGFIVFSPWLLQFLGHVGKENLDWILPAKFSDIFVNLEIFLFGIPKGRYAGMSIPNTVFNFDQDFLFTLVVILLFFVTYFLLRKQKIARILEVLILSFGFVFVLYTLSLFGKHFLVARYVLPSAYFLSILWGVWLSSLRYWVTTLILGIYLVLLLGIHPVQVYDGYNQLIKNLPNYERMNFYILNSFDYVIAKYYLGPERITLYNIDWPEYDPTTWAAIGNRNFKRTETFDTLENDFQGLILYNTEYPWEARSDKKFDSSKFELVTRYNNISIYRSQRRLFLDQNIE